MANTLKCNVCNIVIDELLSYVQNKISVIDEETLKRICVSAFSNDEISKSKSLLFESLSTDQRKIIRKRKGKEERDLEDIISVFKSTDPDVIPVFVARKLERLPPILFDHLDCTKLLKDLTRLNSEIENVKNTYATANQLEEVRADIHNLRYASLPPSMNPVGYADAYVNMKRSAWNLDSGPVGMTLSHNCTSDEQSQHNVAGSSYNAITATHASITSTNNCKNDVMACTPLSRAVHKADLYLNEPGASGEGKQATHGELEVRLVASVVEPVKTTESVSDSAWPLAAAGDLVLSTTVAKESARPEPRRPVAVAVPAGSAETISALARPVAGAEGTEQPSQLAVVRAEPVGTVAVSCERANEAGRADEDFSSEDDTPALKRPQQLMKTMFPTAMATNGNTNGWGTEEKKSPGFTFSKPLEIFNMAEDLASFRNTQKAQKKALNEINLIQKDVLSEKENNASTEYDPITVTSINSSDSEVEVVPSDTSTTSSVKIDPINTLRDSYRDKAVTSTDWLKKLDTRYPKKKLETQEKMRDARRESEIISKVNSEQRIAQLEHKLKYELSIPESLLEEPQASVELPPLTPEQEKLVNRALGPGPPGQLLVEKFNLRIHRRDLQTLSGLNWLNDEVINFYMNLLMQRSQERPDLPPVYAANTFFYPKLMQGGQAGLRRWTRKVDIFAHELMIVPVHLGVHWCVSIVDFRAKKINYLDSMGGSNKQCLDALLDYLRDEHRDKKGQPFDDAGWTTECLKDIPQQMNGRDSGMFSCTFAEFSCRRAPYTFTQAHMPYLRRKAALEILSGKLLL